MLFPFPVWSEDWGSVLVQAMGAMPVFATRPGRRASSIRPRRGQLQPGSAGSRRAPWPWDNFACRRQPTVRRHPGDTPARCAPSAAPGRSRPPADPRCCTAPPHHRSAATPDGRFRRRPTPPWHEPCPRIPLLGFCRAHSLWLVADEVYERLWYETDRPGTPVPSILRNATRDDAVIAIQSFSKSYCMTGWRVGWLVARSDVAQKATQLNEFIVSHAASFTQKAAETALSEGEPEIAAMVRRLRTNRDYCLDAMRQMPRVTLPRPDGAFYLFPKIGGVTDSFEFCKRLLQIGR